MDWGGVVGGTLFAAWGMLLYVKRDAADQFWRRLFAGRQDKVPRYMMIMFVIIGVIWIIGSVTSS
ncbi:MAG: hypothetical protein ABWY77_02300 [Acidimicrobiia bacterium]